MLTQEDLRQPALEVMMDYPEDQEPTDLEATAEDLQGREEMVLAEDLALVLTELTPALDLLILEEMEEDRHLVDRVDYLEIIRDQELVD